MAVKELLFDAQARAKLIRGLNILANTVKVTLGPTGHNVVLQQAWGSPNITKDGVTVAKEIELEDRFENMGAQMVKEVASKTSDVAGDGTTTATILAQSIFTEGVKLVAAGRDAMGIKRGIDKAVSALVEELGKVAKPAREQKEIAQIGAISANSDTAIGDIIAEAMEKVGKEGVITVEEAKGMETTLDVVEGMDFDRGYMSPHFITDKEQAICELEDPLILINEKRLPGIHLMLPLLDQVVKTGKALFIITEDAEADSMTTLVVNNMKGVIKVCAVKAPGFGDKRKAMLEDLAILTGGAFVSEDTGIALENVTPEMMGSAKKVIVTKESTTIVEGAGNPEDVKNRVRQIQGFIESAESDYDREKLQERLAKLIGGVAVIKVGAATETEMKEKKARVEDALHSTRAAVEEGIVPGGGVAFIRCEHALKSVNVADDDEAAGVKVVGRAIEEPLRQIAFNAGFEGSIVVEKVRENKDGLGFNAATGGYEDLVAAGVIDPKKVTRCALQNAASVAALLLTTAVAIGEVPMEEGYNPTPGS